MRHTHLLAAAFVAVIAISCAEDAPESTGTNKSEAPDADAVSNLRAAITELASKKEHTAPRIVVQHILIGFKGSMRGKSVTRTRDEAEELAAQLFSQIQKGADFDALVKKHTDDAYPGRYPMTTADRSGMVRGFGDIGWRLEVGKVGVAPHNTATSPYGWHIIKRVE